MYVQEIPKQQVFDVDPCSFSFVNLSLTDPRYMFAPPHLLRVHASDFIGRGASVRGGRGSASGHESHGGSGAENEIEIETSLRLHMSSAPPPILPRAPALQPSSSALHSVLEVGPALLCA